MTQSTPARKPCGTCGEEYTVTAVGGMRHHFTENPDFQATTDSRKCRGVGEPPAGAAPTGEADGPQCRLCKHPVVLTGNGRARSHLTPEATPRKCPAGSDFPLGTYPDIIGTTDGLVATLTRDCGHREAGECYDCYGARTGEDAGAQPTMADQLKAAGDVAVKTTPVLPEPDGDDVTHIPQASRFHELLRQEVGDPGTVLDRIPAAVFQDHRTPEQKAADAETSRLTREAIRVLEQRTPEQKMATAARMDRTASAVLGLPLDPALNHKYLDSSGTWWVHGGSQEACTTPECEAWRRIHPDGVYCAKCDTDTHRCPGCGTDVPHGTVACGPCNRATCAHPDGFTDNDPVDDDGEGLVFRCKHCGAMEPKDDDRRETLVDPATCPHPQGFTYTYAGERCADCGALKPEDDWRTPDDLLATMPKDVQMLDALRLNCADCKHPVTPLVDQFSLDGSAAVVTWMCQPAIESDYSGVCRDHQCKPDVLVRLGDLDEGGYFIRRGTLMRLTERESRSSVLAEVVDGPHKGRTGELKNLGELVERAPEPRTTGQETTECRDETPARPRSSAATTPTTTSLTTAPGPGSRPPTKASAPAVSPKSQSVTSSAPTAPANGNGGSAVVTTDQARAAAAFLGGRPAATGATGPSNPADAAAQFLAGGSGAHGEKETDRDHWGRYLILHPDTGKEQAWTRATTFAKSISDTYALSQWGLRMALLGATVRPDIVQRAHGKHVKADKKLLDELTADLKNAAGDKVAANLGTSMHSFTELADRAWHSPGGPFSVLDQIPPDCQPLVGAYIQLLKETGLEPVSDLIEFTTLVKQYGVAGTSDNCYKVTRPLTLKIGRAEVLLNPGEYVIGDKKTGKDLDYGWQEIAIQLAVYAQGLSTVGRWDRKEKKWYPKPLGDAKVRLDAGVVLHLPVDKESEKQPAVYGVDLESGWNAAVLCERVRTWRKVRNLAGPVMVSEPGTFTPARTEPAVTTRTTVRPASLKDKANAVTSKGEASAVWQDAKKQGLPDAEVDELVATMQARLRKLAEPGG